MAKRRMNQVDQSFYVRPPGVKDRTSAGGLVVRQDDATGQILIALIHEANADGWFLPKGGVEDGESLEDTARREIHEEAGFSQLTRLAASGAARLGWRRQIWITTHYFLFATRETTGIPTDPKHRYEASWFPLDELPPMFWPDQKELVELSCPFITQGLAAARSGEATPSAS